MEPPPQNDSRGSSSADEGDDVWTVPRLQRTGRSWQALNNVAKVKAVVLNVLRASAVLAFLYLFICSIDLLSSSFQLLGGRTAGEAFSQGSCVTNPICGLMLGLVVTVLLQSSSTSTSIIVTMVASKLLSVSTAIPIVFGANIGTSVTNTLVSLGQANDRDQFRRAFAGATVLDMFKWLSVLVLLPLEIAFHILYHITALVVEHVVVPEDTEKPQFLKVLTNPLSRAIVRIDKNVIRAAARSTEEAKRPLLRFWCPEVDSNLQAEFTSHSDGIDFLEDLRKQLWTMNFNMFTETRAGHEKTILQWQDVNVTASQKCQFLFAGSGLPNSRFTESSAGAILLCASLLVMIVCLVLMVKLLQRLMSGSIASFLHRKVNADLPGCFAPFTGYVAIFVGAGLTILIQSSSVFTSMLTPLVGVGIVTIERVYPLTLGSSVGTTTTGIIAAFTAEPETIHDSLQIAFCHLIFNIMGILIWYPIPLLRNIPLAMAKFLGNTVAQYRWFSIVYLLGLFFLLPGVILGLSFLSWAALLAVGIIIGVLFFAIAFIQLAQSYFPKILPPVLQSWSWLPAYLRSLDPWDQWITACIINIPCCSKYCNVLDKV